MNRELLWRSAMIPDIGPIFANLATRDATISRNLSSSDYADLDTYIT